MMPVRPRRAWLWAVGGSLLIHFALGIYLLLARFDVPAWLRLFFGPKAPAVIALAHDQSPEIYSVADADSPELNSRVRRELDRELEASGQLPPEELKSRLAARRTALNQIPDQNFAEITATLKKVLPGRDFLITPMTNDSGGIEYLLVYTNAVGEREELVFDEEDRQPGGFLHLAEDPRIAPLLRFVLPLTEAPATNRPPPPIKSPGP